MLQLDLVCHIACTQSLWPMPCSMHSCPYQLLPVRRTCTPYMANTNISPTKVNPITTSTHALSITCLHLLTNQRAITIQLSPALSSLISLSTSSFYHLFTSQPQPSSHPIANDYHYQCYVITYLPQLRMRIISDREGYKPF